jgi:hypothetical protein
MSWTPLNITVRVGCNLAYETTLQTPVLFVLKPRPESRVLVRSPTAFHAFRPFATGFTTTSNTVLVPGVLICQRQK